ncbi:MAG: hypothetical protein WC390_10360 [Sulfurimonas sp.]|jgi:hypothetical protein
MSTYTTIQGEITYPDKSHLRDIVADLTAAGWMKDEKFIDECDNITDETTKSDINGLTLRIPYTLYRNLSYRLDEIVKGTTGKIVWTCSDGCFEGGVYTDGVEKHFDLEEWAKEKEDSIAPDINEDFENWSIWAQDVEQSFHEEMMEWQ